MLSFNNQSLALHNGCQEVVSKGGLDRFVRLSWPSMTLTFNTLEANDKNQQLSRGSKIRGQGENPVFRITKKYVPLNR